MKKTLTGIMIGIILVAGSTGMADARDNDKKSYYSPKSHYTPKSHQDKDSGKLSLAEIQAQILALQAQLDELQLTPGPKGADGMKGADGAKGSKGDKGDKGDSCAVTSDSVSVTISCEDGTSAEIIFVPEETGEPGGPGFLSCVDNWCLQEGTIGQYTRCESASADGFTCNNPEIRYGSVEGVLPTQHSGNYLNQWCHQLGFAASAGITYGTRPVAEPFGQLFGCSQYDESTWHWCDWSDGAWFNQTLDYHTAGTVNHITSITCSD